MTAPMFSRLQDKISRNVLISCDHGLMIVNRFDCDDQHVGHGRFLLDHGNACSMEADICARAITTASAPVIFDIGANIGAFTTWMSRAFPLGKIYAIEPQRQVFQMLCGNLAINNLFNVHAHNVAMGKDRAVIEVPEPDYSTPNDFGRFSLQEKRLQTTTSTIKVEIVTLDDFMAWHAIQDLSLLKIDAEGMDLEILAGARASIARFRPAIFIEYSDTTCNQLDDIQHFLNGYDYQYQVFANNVLCWQTDLHGL